MLFSIKSSAICMHLLLLVFFPNALIPNAFCYALRNTTICVYAYI